MTTDPRTARGRVLPAVMPPNRGGSGNRPHHNTGTSHCRWPRWADTPSGASSTGTCRASDRKVAGLYSQLHTDAGHWLERGLLRPCLNVFSPNHSSSACRQSAGVAGSIPMPALPARRDYSAAPNSRTHRDLTNARSLAKSPAPASAGRSSSANRCVLARSRR